TNIPGVMALRESWPRGAWVLAISVGGREGPTALVGVGADGTVQSVNVPTRSDARNTWGREVTGKDIEDALREVALGAPGAPAGAERLGHAGLVLLIPAVLGLAALRRR